MDERTILIAGQQLTAENLRRLRQLHRDFRKFDWARPTRIQQLIFELSSDASTVVLIQQNCCFVSSRNRGTSINQLSRRLDHIERGEFAHGSGQYCGCPYRRGNTGELLSILLAWGGWFNASASVQGPLTKGDTFLFELFANKGPTHFASAMDYYSSFNTSFSEFSPMGVFLEPGPYSIGFEGTNVPDPTMVISFDTPVTGDVPEVSTWAMMLIGFLSIGFLRRKISLTQFS